MAPAVPAIASPPIVPPTLKLQHRPVLHLVALIPPGDGGTGPHDAAAEMVYPFDAAFWARRMQCVFVDCSSFAHGVFGPRYGPSSNLRGPADFRTREVSQASRINMRSRNSQMGRR